MASVGTYGALATITSTRLRNAGGSGWYRSPAYTRPPTGARLRPAHRTAA